MSACCALTVWCQDLFLFILLFILPMLESTRGLLEAWIDDGADWGGERSANLALLSTCFEGWMGGFEGKSSLYRLEIGPL